MLRVVAHKSAVAARQYYAEGLKREDYYSEGQEIVGKWHGRATAMLGLTGDVTPEAFAALVENRHPATGERITPRTNKDRTVGYDLNFHAPKSLSVLHGLTGDKEILKAFRSAVAETMREIEQQADTRVRKKGAQDLRTTGNLAWAEFVHFTARPVGGIPDPHLHIHCFTQNITFDSVEDRWKAAMFRQIKADAPYHEAAFHARLAAKIEALGYGIDRTKFGWELAGIPRTLIDKFSRRSAQIDELAAAKGILDPKAKDALGAATRQGKRRGLSKIDLLTAWGVRLTEQEKVIIARVHDKMEVASKELITARYAVDFACEKMFARNSVVPQNRLVAEALRYGVGQVVPEKIWKELAAREMVVRKVGDEVLCTSLDVLSEEVELINFVRAGRSKHAPLASGKAVLDPKLSAEQAAAVRHVLKSRDQVIAIRGGAGVGKTTLMKEAVAQIEAGGARVFAFAPSAVASRETLREAGFAGAETVAHLLQNAKLQAKIRGQVIWIDEAGLLGTRDLWEIMKVAGSSTRVILTGDSGQHAPVARGDAFRLLQRYAGLRIAQVSEIRRQETETYKSAVAALAKGDLQTGFRRLDDLGAIIEVANETDRYKLLAHEFMELGRKGQPPLVVSPTHAESAKVTAAIRDAKRDAGKLKNEREFIQHHNLQWETADKKQSENYSPGMVVQFHQNAKGIKRGELFSVTGHTERGAVKLTGAGGREIPLPLKDAARFQVFEERRITLGKGDQIRITRNGKSADGRRINNGNVFGIEKFTKKGDIILSNGAVLPADHGHLAYGYCSTSHASQSKSVGHVLVAQSEESFVASSREQFYVSVSRGKSSIKIFTDNRRGLQDAVGNTSTRTSAVELAGISKGDFASMTGGLNSTQWRDQVQSRKSEGMARSHVQNLLKERHQQALKKQPGHSWRQYVEMRKGMAGPDGKSRSKGHPAAEQKKGGSVQKGKSFLRPTELSDAAKAKVTGLAKTGADKPAKVKPQLTVVPKGPAKPAGNKIPSRKDRMVNAYQAAAKNLSRVAEHIKKSSQSKLQAAAAKIDNVAQKAKASLPKPRNNMAQVADHALKHKAAQAAKAAKPQPVKTKAVAPPPPTPKK